MRPLEFYARPTYTMPAADGSGQYLQRVSAAVRAEQVAMYLGVPLNPRQSAPDAVRVYVKPKAYELDRVPSGAWVDVLDDLPLVEAMKARPDLRCLAASLSNQEYLERELRRPVVLIPHHHVNWERRLRPSREVKVCGYIGSANAWHVKHQRGVDEALAAVGLEYRPLYHYQTREEICEYLLSIDIQVIPYFNYADLPHRHPGKIVNAMAFGIPTIAGPVQGFREVESDYLPADNLLHLAESAQRLRNHDTYGFWTHSLPEIAEAYHISRTAPMYRSLD